MISVIVPTFNRGDLIAQTVDSILSQSLEDFELIVVDDHSVDNTGQIVADYAESDARVIYVKRPSHYPKGANSCRNFGFEIANGHYIKWLDSDDLLTPDALKIQLGSLESSGADLSICNADVFFSDPTTPSHRWGNIRNEASVSNFLTAMFRWHTCAGLWRKAYFVDMPPWREGLMNSQEWVMHLTQLVNDVKIVREYKTLCLVRSHVGSMSFKSNKSARYFYNECRARGMVFDLLVTRSFVVSNKAYNKIRYQFFVYQFFILYKLDFFLFLKTFRIYPSFFRFAMRCRKYNRISNMIYGVL